MVRLMSGSLVQDADIAFDESRLTLPVTTVETTFTNGGVVAPGCHGSGKVRGSRQHPSRQSHWP